MKSMKVTPAAVKALRQRAYEMIESAGSTPLRLKRVARLLHGCSSERTDREQAAREREQYELDAAKAGLERRGEWKEVEEVNPLDDDERLRQVRIAVFG